MRNEQLKGEIAKHLFFNMQPSEKRGSTMVTCYHQEREIIGNGVRGTQDQFVCLP